MSFAQSWAKNIEHHLKLPIFTHIIIAKKKKDIDDYDMLIDGSFVWDWLLYYGIPVEQRNVERSGRF